MDESTEELDPLFDYSRVRPIHCVYVDDDDSPDELPTKRLNTSEPAVQVVDDDVEVTEVKNSENKDEEDWLPPPPKISGHSQDLLGENSMIKELRLKKLELQQSLARSAEDVLRAVESSVRRDLSSSIQSSLDDAAEQKLKAPLERTKIVISFQDKDELRQFRVYKDEKFERIFKMYVDKVKLDIQSLGFSFDGDIIHSAATPNSLGMEDDDIIEVHAKKK
ncbi:hypothetical protein K2173_010095 [Erythroxylum novogranatense]|uniref:Rad60/SUMO-like domain-containing protein n=1 Tax=Erythroxylum novogranatense TaxID=1862640 RepID=A0AAV8S6L1_9ROSI|nr:hypothetical protein K2173_010095 [Erythroxylum novogranatense]